MFFEGCSPQLGCTIKLRGASEYELARVKEIIVLMVSVAYHSQLEISFLMDEFAMPPSLAKTNSFPCLLERTTVEEEESQENGTDQSTLSQGGETVLGEEEEKPSLGKSVSESSSPKDVHGVKVNKKHFLSSSSSLGAEGVESSEVMTSTPLSNRQVLPPPVSPPYLIDDLEELADEIGSGKGETEGGSGSGVLGRGESREESSGSETPPRLFRDPLQDDTGLFVTEQVREEKKKRLKMQTETRWFPLSYNILFCFATEQVASTDDRLKTLTAGFKQELKDIILCISPFITFREPFLLTPAGLRCPSRDYFPQQVCLLTFTVFIEGFSTFLTFFVVQ